MSEKVPNIHEKHRERMFSKYMSASSDSFPDHELLEILLFYSRPRVNTNDIAHNLINKFGSFTAVFEASVEDIAQVDGMGEKSAILVKLVFDIMRRYDLARIKKAENFVDKRTAGEYLASRFAYTVKEKLIILLLDNDCSMIDCKVVEEGTVNCVDTNFRKIINLICSANASSIYIAHNHPGGAAKPSDEDLAFTYELRELCRNIGVTVNDHFVVANGEYTSVIDYMEKVRYESLGL